MTRAPRFSPLRLRVKTYFVGRHRFDWSKIADPSPPTKRYRNPRSTRLILVAQACAFTLRTRSRLATTCSLHHAKHPNFHSKLPPSSSLLRRVRATLSIQLHDMSSQSSRSSFSSQSPRYRSQSIVGEGAPPVGRERLSIQHLVEQPRPRTSSTSTGSPHSNIPVDYTRQRVSSTHIPGATSSRHRSVAPGPSRLGPGAGSPHGYTAGANPPDTRGRTYTLEVEQHPERTAEFGPAELSRLPLAPAPIVKLTIRDHTGSTIDPNTELPYLIAHLSLCSESGHPLDGVPGASSQHLLYGTLVSSPQVMRNLRGRVAPYFIFPDVSIRQRGRYSLCISLLRLPVGGSPASVSAGSRGSVLASVYTQVFEVVSHTNYIAPPPTQLTQLFIRQGARMT